MPTLQYQSLARVLYVPTPSEPDFNLFQTVQDPYDYIQIDQVEYGNVIDVLLDISFFQEHQLPFEVIDHSFFEQQESYFKAPIGIWLRAGRPIWTVRGDPIWRRTDG